MAKKVSKKPQKKVFIDRNLKCPFCTGKTEPSYKNYQELYKYITDRAKITPSERTGVCSKHQRLLTREIKRARFLALLPFTPQI